MGFLCDLHADLTASEVDFEWIIAVDGTQRRRVPDPIAADRRIRILQIGRQVGAAAARNLALGLARGTYVTSADDDDHLPAESLTTRLEAAMRHGVGWVAGALADLYGEELIPSELRLPTGVVAPGDVWRAWGCPCLAFPVGPTTLLVETGLLRRVGGWQGLPQAEDLGMVLSVTARTVGIMLDTVVYAYRKHAHQMTVSKEFGQLEPLVRHITYERGRLLAPPQVPGSLAPEPGTARPESILRLGTTEPEPGAGDEGDADSEPGSMKYQVSKAGAMQNGQLTAGFSPDGTDGPLLARGGGIRRSSAGYSRADRGLQDGLPAGDGDPGPGNIAGLVGGEHHVHRGDLGGLAGTVKRRR